MSEKPLIGPDELAHEATLAAQRALGLGEGGSGVPSALQHEQLPAPLPTLLETLENADGLTGSFTYAKQAQPKLAYNPDRDAEQVPMTEAEGLREACAFLQDFIQTVDADAGASEADRQLAAQAADILHNTTYIDERTLDQAASMFASAWKQKLDDDPTKSLYLWSVPNKSSTYILDRVLGNFSDADIEKYRGRLHFLYDAGSKWENGRQVLKELPPNSEVVMAEDSIDTGRQFANDYSDEQRKLHGTHPAEVSLYLVTASAESIAQGAYTNSTAHNIPIVAYSTVRPAADGKPRRTSIYSTSDDRFEIPIGGMVTSLRERYGRPDTMMPPLTNIMRVYSQPDYVPANIARVASAYGEAYGPEAF